MKHARWIALATVLTLGCGVEAPDLRSLEHLIAHWSFDEGEGEWAYDASGFGHHVQIGDGHWSEWGRGSGDSLAFNSQGGGASVVTFDIHGEVFTIAGWIFVRPSNSLGQVLSKATSDAAYDHLWMLGITTPSDGPDSPRLRFRLQTTAAGGALTLLAESPLPMEEWVHATAVYDGAQMRLYQDGLLVGSASKTGNVSTDPSTPVAIGANPNGSERFDGRVDELRVYNHALSPERIEAIVSVPEAL